MHEKLYCFSHPKPVAFIGSFNPSGDSPEAQPDIIAEIGDQDRGHNVLVGLNDPTLVNCLMDHARRIYRARPAMLFRFSSSANSRLKGEDTDIYFWPRVRSHPVMKFLNRIAPQARIRIAASHIKGKSMARALIGLVRRGAGLEILAESTLRRVPKAIEGMLTGAGIPFQRVSPADGVPMHHKFALVEKNDRRWVAFGSFNWTTRSYWLNHEIGAISTNPQIFEVFANCWDSLKTPAGGGIKSGREADTKIQRAQGT